MYKIVIFIAALCTVGCSGGQTHHTDQEVSADSSKDNVTQTLPDEESNMITVVATVRYKSMEGGFFALDADNGKKYMPRGMNKDLLIDGMKVEVVGTVMSDILTFQQYGEVLKVSSSRIIDQSNAKRKMKHNEF